MSSTTPATRGKPRPGTTERRPQYDLESLLAVSVQVFTERGYDGTSMEDLSRASGITKSSFYHHVSGKEELLRLALEHALEPLLASTREPGATTGTAIERLRYIIRRDVEILADRLPYVTLLLRVHGNTETERWALAQRRGFDKIVAGLVQEAIDDGDVRPGVDARTTARLIFGTINSVIEWYRPGTDHAPGDLADQILALVFNGISNGRPRAARRTS
jgi:AcrR family transcriptional regulator